MERCREIDRESESVYVYERKERGREREKGVLSSDEAKFRNERKEWKGWIDDEDRVNNYDRNNYKKDLIKSNPLCLCCNMFFYYLL